MKNKKYFVYTVDSTLPPQSSGKCEHFPNGESEAKLAFEKAKRNPNISYADMGYEDGLKAIVVDCFKKIK